MKALSASLRGFESEPEPEPEPASVRPVKNWIAVASAEHVRVGRDYGFMQVCHGKAAPLKRLRPGDRIAYYSPSGKFGGMDKLQSFTAHGVVLERAPYLVDMGGGFTPFRRDVAWAAGREASIQPLLDRLEFSRGRQAWGYQLRFGLFEISGHDMGLIAEAMGATGRSAHQ